MSESLVSVCLAIGSVIGVLGTVAFPRLSLTIGLEQTGLLGFTSQTLCLALCIVSVFTPGSPFQPNFLAGGHVSIKVDTTILKINSGDNVGPYARDGLYLQQTNAGSPISGGLVGVVAPTNGTEHPVIAAPESYVSIALLMVGIITSRFGKLYL